MIRVSKFLMITLMVVVGLAPFNIANASCYPKQHHHHRHHHRTHHHHHRNHATNPCAPPPPAHSVPPPASPPTHCVDPIAKLPPDQFPYEETIQSRDPNNWCPNECVIPPDLVR